MRANIDGKDLLIVRQTCIKAAAEVVAAHPETEVAYDPKGKPIGPSTVEIGDRLATLAERLETWALRAPAEDLATVAKRLLGQNGAAPDDDDADDEEDEPAPPPRRQKKAKPAARRRRPDPEDDDDDDEPDDDVDLDVCPRHEAAAQSTYVKGQLFCDAVKSCKWKRQMFKNEDGSRVVKWNWDERWLTRSQYVKALREEGLA